MPDTSKLDTFVQVDIDVHDGDYVEIAGAGVMVDIEDQRSHEKITKLRIPVIVPAGDTKDITLNDTSRRALATAYGKNSEDWVGKEAMCTIVTKDVFGQFKKVLYLNPVKARS